MIKKILLLAILVLSIIGMSACGSSYSDFSIRNKFYHTGKASLKLGVSTRKDIDSFLNSLKETNKNVEIEKSNFRNNVFYDIKVAKELNIHLSLSGDIFSKIEYKFSNDSYNLIDELSDYFKSKPRITSLQKTKIYRWDNSKVRAFYAFGKYNSRYFHNLSFKISRKWRKP